MKRIVCGLLLTLCVTSVASAARLNAACTKIDGADQIVGSNQEKLYEIASVSKVMTSYWALKTLSPSFRFSTVFHIKPAATEGKVDIHIQGGMDPFFMRESLQYVVYQLNAMKIRKVQNLTFDEGFKFLASTVLNDVVVGHYALNDPKPERVKEHLRLVLENINRGLSNLRQRSKGVIDTKLPAEVSFRASRVAFLPSVDFKAQTEWKDAKTFVHKSSPLLGILKEMNRSSNNYAANIIFESLGGAKEFKEFIEEDLRLNENDIQFYNGSGDRLDLTTEISVYNMASCKAVIGVIEALKEFLEREKMELHDVMALAGKDVAGQESTVTNMYGGAAMDGALIGKSGTVCPGISLAGLASTNQGDIFYTYIYKTQCTNADWRSARLKIRNNMLDLFTQNKGKRAVEYKATQFLTFDNDSALAEVNLSGNVLP